MAIFDSIRNDFLGICIPMAYYLCLLPDVLETESKSFKVTCNIYSWLLRVLALICQTCEFVKLCQLLLEDEMNYEEIIRNVTITSIHFTALPRCVMIKGKFGGEIFKKIIKFERDIYDSQNQDLISVYQLTLSAVKRAIKYYSIGILMVIVSYIAAPGLRDPRYIQRGNETILVKEYPLSSWSPLDNYWFTYIWTSSQGAFLTTCFFVADIICFSFIFFGICQLEVLHYYISDSCRRPRTMMADRESFRMRQRECILMHQEIISYVNDFTNNLKYKIVLDFLFSSIQIAGLTLQIMRNMSFIQCMLLASSVLILVGRMYIYCFSAQNLTERSLTIGNAWYQLNWMELPHDVRTNIVLCIARSQKPLQLTIGDFQTISLATFVAVMKATYSYLMLMSAL